MGWMEYGRKGRKDTRRGLCPRWFCFCFFDVWDGLMVEPGFRRLPWFVLFFVLLGVPSQPRYRINSFLNLIVYAH